jgi:hypothetical protein
MLPFFSNLFNQTASVAIIIVALSVSSITAEVLLPGSSAKARLDDPVKVDPATEKVIRSALAYLASKQAPNGAWLGESGEEVRYPIALTAYSLMAFQAAGNLPGEGEFGKNVTLAVRYLLSEIDDQGLIGDETSGQYMYFHGIASIALGELFGQTGNDTLRTKLAKMIKVIVSSQNPQGGWRYKPISHDADISVTVLAVVALRAAKNGGIAVPQKTIDDAVDYVRKCFNERDGGFGYQPGQGSGFARTAAAIYSLQVCGLYDDPKVASGSKYLSSRFKPGERWFTYGNFYAAPAQYMIGGKTWSDWYSNVNRVLKEKVRTDDKGNNFWERELDGSSPGPIYSTAVYTMILAMPYHYLPLYQR